MSCFFVYMYPIFTVNKINSIFMKNNEISINDLYYYQELLNKQIEIINRELSLHNEQLKMAKYQLLLDKRIELNNYIQNKLLTTSFK